MSSTPTAWCEPSCTIRRNFDEIKRIILALQKADADACATPADWRPGDDVIVPTAGSCGVAKERMDNQSENQYCLDWFMCFRKEGCHNGGNF